MTVTVPEQPKPVRQRDRALDIFRGVCILEVVLHHLSGFARDRVTAGSFSHDFYILINRSLHFAVPAFLFIMAVLLTRIMVGKSRSWTEFYTRRVQQTLIPYLIWSVFYAGFRTWAYPQYDPPSVLLDTDRWQTWLLWGKAWYHLYFLVLAIQLYIAFPLLLAVVRRIRFGPWGVLALGLVIQFGVWQLHRKGIVPLRFPAAVLLSHSLPVLAGVWVGANLDQWDRTWRSLRFAAVPALVIGLAYYLPQGYRQLAKTGPVDSQLYQYGFWAYCIGVAFCLLAFARFLDRQDGRLAAGLQSLGVQSMPIYILHPLLLYFCTRITLPGNTLAYHGSILLIGIAAVAAPLLAFRTAGFLRVGHILFGRASVPRPRPAPAPPVEAAGSRAG
jgi:peptidoglycan/LPS O-acetylase OafA/YrhL